MPLPKKCRISKGTTLSELANFFDLSQEQLRQYHNIYCPLEDLIEDEIAPNTTIIFIPPDDKILRERIFNSKGGNFIKYINPCTLEMPTYLDKKYGFIQTSYRNNRLEHRIHYEIKIRKNGNILTLNRTNFYINNCKTDLIIEQFLEEIGNVIYPLQIKSIENESFLKISNFDEIKNRWNILKKQLTVYYKGDIIHKIIGQVDKSFRNEKVLRMHLLDSSFYFLFFQPIYSQFEDDFTKSFNTEVPLLFNNQKIPYNFKYKIDNTISDTKKFLINLKGSCLDKRTPKQIENGKFVIQNLEQQTSLVSSDFDVEYKLNTKDNSIFSIFGKIRMQLDTFEKKIIFECYEQS
ncbi:hypothetical protein PG291_09620 [Riemerella anatipestifer]|nr:hypothetical protein [Riemerella anatipestifer]